MQILLSQCTSHDAHAPAGQKRCVPHLHVPGLMKTPERFHTDNKTARRALKLAVACNAVGGVFIKETTGTAYSGYHPGKQYEVVSRGGLKAASSMVSEEYLDFLRSALEHFKKQAGFRRVSAGALLVHDKSAVHTSAAVMHGLKRMGLDAVVQPPRSPDVMPLDYGIFGFTKLALERAVPRNAPWSDRVQKFRQLLTQCNPRPTIEEYPLRLQAIVDSRGEHIVEALKALKKARSGK